VAARATEALEIIAARALGRLKRKCIVGRCVNVTGTSSQPYTSIVPRLQSRDDDKPLRDGLQHNGRV